MDILISGAGVAGPALAWWLGAHGHRPTVVEAAPALRTGGSAVDFRGPLHLGILDKMGIVPALRAVETGGTAMRFVDARGDLSFAWPASLAGGDLEIQRGDLSRILAEAAGDRTEYVFGDRVTALDEDPAGVDVTFAHGPGRRFDLVIGADGVHSAIRRLAFGPEADHVKHLGYYVAGWETPNEWGLGTDLHLHSAPGRTIGAQADRRDPSIARTLCVFASPLLARSPDTRKQILRARFAGTGWIAPRLLEGLEAAEDLYFDQICRVDSPAWTRGRIALVGDAACGATIGGQGTGTALVSAYVLAGELAAANGDHRVAFPAYERRIAKFARGTQKGGDTVGRFMAPKTARGIRLRDAMNRQKWMLTLTRKIAADRSTDLALPDYETAAIDRRLRPLPHTAR